jgi:hydroxymethylpyrimidine pyrophosphatase-like HAD family hydrolase
VIIAVDFNGTIVEHENPKIGKAFPFAIETLKELQKNGHQIILWTYRTSRQLDESIKFCHNKGV